MATIKINGKDYDSDNLPEDAKKQLASLIYVQNELKRLEAQIAAFKTAEMAYGKALENAID
tara:strand:+ start:210 stop:392 length:183 start_codon:yes stop_codon:yes gene_type:complete